MTTLEKMREALGAMETSWYHDLGVFGQPCYFVVEGMTWELVTDRLYGQDWVTLPTTWRVRLEEEVDRR